MEAIPPPSDSALSVVVMAKAAVPGRVKTRLTRTAPGTAAGSGLSGHDAAEIHRAMLSTVLTRVKQFIGWEHGDVRWVLAMDEIDGAAEFVAADPGWRVTTQGSGGLGERLDRVWRGCVEATGSEAVVFFGVDCPDVPGPALAEIGPSLGGAGGGVAVGRVSDGGYWTLASGRYRPELFLGIDWGTPAVYDQTLSAAAGHGLRVYELPPWHDVDEAPDLVALRDRLRADAAGPTPDPRLAELADRITPFLKKITPMSDPPVEPMATPPGAAEDPRPADASAPTPGGLSASPPPEAAAHATEAELSEPEPDFSDSTLLLVDDNEQNVELLQAYLEAMPCKTLTALDGEQAMAIIDDPDQPLPDLVLLDVMMPRMSGFEVCQKIKDDPRTRAIPVMMVTALNELGDIERGVEAGTDDFLTKPVNKLELLTRVKSLLRVRHLKRELDRTEAYIEDLEKGREQ